MKHLLFIFSFLISIAIYAQSPQAFKYQAVVRDNNGNVLVNKIVSIRTSILQGSTSGSSVYTETQSSATNDFGVVALNIGQGTLVSGNFSSINWGADSYFIKTEVDLTGGSNYQFMGTTQLMSVPYALYAAKSGLSNNDQDTSATNELQQLNINGQTLSISNGNSVTVPDNQTLNLNGNSLSISGGNTINLPPDNDADTTNEIQFLNFNAGTLSISKSNSVTIPDNDNQQLSITGQNLSISNGNNITIPDNQTLSLNSNNLTISGGNTIVLPPDSDANPTNEIQALSLVNDTLYLSNGGFVNLTPFKDNTDSQQLSINGNQLQISGGNSVTITGAVDLDADPINELQYLSRNGDTLFLSQGNYTILPKEKDSDTTNEIQHLILTNDTLKISNSNYVLLKDTSSTNELQNLSLNESELSISNGNTINFGGIQNTSFPDGFKNLKSEIISTNFSVPIGKNLYITFIESYGNTQTIYRNGTLLLSYQNTFNTLMQPFIFNENDLIELSASGLMVGFTVDKIVTPVVLKNISFNNPYIVPSGKKLFILNTKGPNLYINNIAIYISSTGPGQIQTGNNTTIPLNGLTIPIILNSGDTVSGDFINGYLK